MTGPGGSPRKSLCYRRFRGKSPQPAGIFEGGFLRLAVQGTPPGDIYAVGWDLPPSDLS